MKQSILLILAVFFAIFQASAQTEHYAEKTTCGGTERWSVKVLTDTGAATVNYSPVASTVAALCGLTTFSAASNDPRHPGLEHTTYEVSCHITIKKSESDNDYHLVLSDGTNTLVGEIPDPACSQAASSAHVSEFINCRNFITTHIGTGNYYSISLPQVIVTGVAFVDIPHGVTGAAPNNLELHPVIDVHFAGSTSAQNVPEAILKVAVGPNPFSNRLSITATSKAEEFKNCTLQIYDMRANIVANMPITASSSFEINAGVTLPDLPNGNYIYRLLNNSRLMYEGKLTCAK